MKKFNMVHVKKKLKRSKNNNNNNNNRVLNKHLQHFKNYVVKRIHSKIYKINS